MILHSTNLPLSNQRGIALGPVLFIIAILAILAAAIAAGSGAFNANTRDENGKAMAEVVINSCHAYQDALQIMLHNECEETKLDFTPMGWPDGSTAAFQNGDFTGGNGTNRAGNGRCAFFHPQGGGMFFKPLPAAALVTNPTGAYTASTASYSGEIATNIDAFAGYPDFQGDTCQYHGGSCQGAQNNSALYLKYYYLNYSTCQQINSILKLNFDPNSTNLTLGDYKNNIWSGHNVVTYPGYVDGGGIQGHQDVMEGCAYDYLSNSGGHDAYVYMCPLMIR